MRTLMSAITIAPDVIAAFGLSPSWSEPTPSCVIVIADRASQAMISLFSNPVLTDHLMT
jgi:hypothetical protein